MSKKVEVPKFATVWHPNLRSLKYIGQKRLGKGIKWHRKSLILRFCIEHGWPDVCRCPFYLLRAALPCFCGIDYCSYRRFRSDSDQRPQTNSPSEHAPTSKILRPKLVWTPVMLLLSIFKLERHASSFSIWSNITEMSDRRSLGRFGYDTRRFTFNHGFIDNEFDHHACSV